MPGFRNQAVGTIAANAQAVTLAWREAFNGGVGLQLAGTFTGTVTLEVTLDGTNWVPLQGVNVSDGTPGATLIASGIMAADVIGAVAVRAVGGGWGSGTANVTLVGLPG
jgi:hypothetical protein